MPLPKIGCQLIIFGGKYTGDDKKWYFASNFSIGDEPENKGPGYGNRTLLNFIFDYNVSDKVEFVIENTTGIQENNAKPR